MVRKLASVLVSLAVISPAWVQALGLGEIQLNSFLNQPLDAQIEILSSTKGETDGLQVKLASPEAFVRSGLEFSNHLRQLKFSVITRSNGKKYIKVVTRKGFREPFLNFLLEVNWASGRILREYSELVDPPSLIRSSPSSSQTIGTTTPPVTTSTSRKSSPQAPQPPLYGATSRDSSSGFIGDTYKTKRNDTAWQIANEARQDDQVSVEQSMMAILRANPRAFIRQNINRLKAGYVLTIPDKDSMLSQSHSDALAEVRRQTRAWRNRGKSTVAQTSPDGRLEILPPQTDSSGQEQASGSSTAGKEKLHREVMLAKEATEAQRQENAELRLRVSELEEQISNSNKLATLKADQLAALEKKLKELNAASTETPASTPVEETVPPVADAEPTATEPEAPVAPETTPVEEETAPKQYQPVVEAVTAKPGTPINQHVVSGYTPVDINALPKSELPAHPFKTGSSPDGEAVAEMGLIDKAIAYFKENPVIKWIVGGAIGILVLILGIMFARRGKGDEQFEESILHEQAMEETSALEETATFANEDSENLFETMDSEDHDTEGKQDVTDTSFLNDMVLSDMSDMEGEGAESDPLTEADVFLAYGRFGPAESMIKSAIEKEPERNDLRLKLLEIYYSSKNKDAFEQEAASFKNDLSDKPDTATWDKVVEMGEDLCPASTLFVVGGAVAADAVQSALDDSDSVVAVDEEDTEIMDFDLSEFEDQIDNMEAENQLDTAAPMPEQGDELDLDLDKLMGDEASDENLDKTLEITTELENIADVLNTEEETLDLPDITEEFESDVIPLHPEITQEMDIPDLDMAGDATLPMDEDLDMDDDALADIDEVGTKLDLARAYIDMGDPEGAKSILEEVMEEGDDTQKGEAKDLLAQI